MTALRRLTNRRVVLRLVVVVALILLVLADQRGLLLVPRHDDQRAYHARQTRVTRIISARTIEVDVPDRLHETPTTIVRLWGVRECESEATQRAAERWMRDSIRDEPVTIWLEPQRPRDPAGRLIAHLECSDGTIINEELLERGLLIEDETWPHNRVIRYAQLATVARRSGAGCWSAGDQ